MRRSLRRMMGGALQAVCPPGFLCMDTGFIIFLGMLMLSVGVGIYLYINKPEKAIISDRKDSTDRTEPKKTTEPLISYDEDDTYITVKKPKRQPEITWTQSSFQMPQRSNSTQTRYPPPDRDYDSVPDLRGFIPPPGIVAVPINVPTQGLPQEFQQMGVLTAPGGSSMSASPNRTLLPLLGRRSANSRDRYNYYTRTDGLNPIQVPVSFKNRGCEDDTGCDEIFSGDSVGVPLLGQTFTANVYKYNTPRYIPLS